MKSRASDKASFYHQLGNLLAGGVGLRIALESLAEHLPKARLRKIANECLLHLEQGQAFYLALAQQANWFDPFEIAIFEAGEKAGQLSEICRQLSDFWLAYAEAEHDFFVANIYPLFLIHFAFLVSATLRYSEQGALGFFDQLIGSLGIFYALIFLLFLLFRYCKTLLQTFFIKVPGLRNLAFTGALYRFVFTLRLQLQAAIPLRDAISLAFQAGDHPSLKALAEPVIEQVKQGKSLTEAFQPLFTFSPYLKSFFATGETSGKILETLNYVENYLSQQWRGNVKRLSRWLPRLIYFIVVMYVAMQIIAFYGRYYNTLNNLE
ncbi:MAG: type II secretion system F family protein [Verrucomicrobiae bacterium]|nr:type II secretion system F family protein [Verrucomicrobiae bacterium]